MATWSLTSSATATSSTSSNWLKLAGVLTLVQNTVAAGVVAPAAWPYVLPSSGDLNGSIPWFEAPVTWPPTSIPGP